MSKLKRDCIKYIRDKAKSAYEKDTECRICGTNESLELHHYKTLTELLRQWLKETKLSSEDVLEWREEFIEKHRDDLYVHVVTLCKTHHAQLHGVYGKNPNLGTAAKQGRWVQRQREKHGLD